MNELVEVKNNQVVVSSRKVAEHFGKYHKDVLDSVREILAAENSAAKFFQETTYENRGKQYPEYLMNRDGFTLLAMSFTGKEAMQWKLKYIEAFNSMEKELSSKSVKQPNPLKALELEIRLNNSRARLASEYRKIAEATDLPDYKRICQQKAAEVLAGAPVLPMQEADRKTLSATEIGKILGITACKVGLLANKFALKSDAYGKYFYDKASNSNKQVETFRYYENAVEKFKEILEGGAAK